MAYDDDRDDVNAGRQGGRPVPRPRVKATTVTTIELAQSRALTAQDLLDFVTALPSDSVRDDVHVTVEQGDSQREGQWFKITGRWTR